MTRELDSEQNNSRVSEEKLNAVIEDIKRRGKNSDFDCIIGLSGGRDSCYLAYMLTHKHGLRCVAAYYRTPFTPNTTDSNVRRIVRKLGMPLKEIHLSHNFHRDVARRSVILWRQNPTLEIANLVCASCKLLFRDIYRIANKHHVNTFLYADSKYEELHVRPAYVEGYDNRNLRNLKVELRRLRQIILKGITTLLQSPGLLRDLPVEAVAALLYLQPNTAYLRLRYPKICAINYFEFAQWKEAECLEVLEKLGWILPSGCFSTWKTDCVLAELKNYMFRYTSGISYTDAFISNMVRDGVITKDNAVQRLKVESRISLERFSESLRLLGLPENFFSTLESDHSVPL